MKTRLIFLTWATLAWSFLSSPWDLLCVFCAAWSYALLRNLQNPLPRKLNVIRQVPRCEVERREPSWGGMTEYPYPRTVPGRHR